MQTPLYRPPALVQTCVIVRPGDRDPYAEMLAGVPDLVDAGIVPDYNPQRLDAMRMPGRPVDGVMGRWTATAARTYGGVDAAGGQRHSEHVAKYGASEEMIHAK